MFHGVHTEVNGVLVLHYKPNAPNNPDPNPKCTVYAQNNFLAISLIAYNDALCWCF